MNELDRKKLEEMKTVNGNFTDALMRMWSLHNQEVQELRKLYQTAITRIKELEAMVEKSEPAR